MRLNTLESYVLQALETSTRARNDDFILYKKVCELIGVNMKATLETALIHHKAYKLPIFEAVTRCRRKILEKRPDLEGKNTRRARKEQEEKYIEYNRGM